MNHLYHHCQPSCFSISEDDHQYYQNISSIPLINTIPQTSRRLSTSSSYLVHFQAYPQKEIMNNEVDQSYKQEYQIDDGATIPPPCGKIISYETKINPSDTSQPMIGEDGSNRFNNKAQLKWMSSKMRIMKKMIYSDQTAASSSVINNEQASQSRQQTPTYDVDEPSPTKIRVCSDCNTTKTPLWRGGPQGPKSLCNACGIRQRKAKRAAAAASEGLLGGTYASNHKVMKTKRSGFKDQTAKYKKRCKLSTTDSSASTAPSTSENSIEFDELRMSLSKSLAIHHILIPQDEKEAAILLMALSCGLVNG